MRAPRSLLLAIALAVAPLASEAATEPPASPPQTADSPVVAHRGRLAPQAAITEPLPPAQLTERKLKTPERLQHRPSGFWTSNRPAQGGAYRYGKLIVGTALAAATGVLMFLLARRASRAPRPAWPTSHGSGGDRRE